MAKRWIEQSEGRTLAAAHSRSGLSSSSRRVNARKHAAQRSAGAGTAAEPVATAAKPVVAADRAAVDVEDDFGADANMWTPETIS
jgi:hypothetical protein